MQLKKIRVLHSQYLQSKKYRVLRSQYVKITFFFFFGATLVNEHKGFPQKREKKIQGLLIKKKLYICVINYFIANCV